jgi:O-antigen ligase
MRLHADLQNIALRVALVAAALGIGVLSGVSPAIGVAAALGLAFALIVLADIRTGVCLFAFAVFIEVLPQAGSLSVFKALGLLLALSWVAAAASRETSDSLFSARPFLSTLILVFLGWTMISLTWAESTSSGLTSISRYLLNLTLFPIVWTAIRTRRDVVLLLGAIVAGATLAAVAGILSPPTPSNEGFESASRATGTIGDPNQFAAVLVVGLALAGAFVMAPLTAGGLRVVAAGSALLCVLGIFLSLSRGGLIAMGCAILASVVVAGRWRPILAVAAGVLCFGALAYFAVFAGVPARERITTVQGGSGRTSLWTVAWRMIDAHPVRGVGAGNFPVSSVHYLLSPGVIQRDEKIIATPDVTHNTFLQIQTELGIVGLMAFLGIVATSLMSMVRAARTFAGRNDWRLEILCRGTFVALVGLLAADFFISEMYSKLLWLLLALGPVLLGVAVRSQSERPAPVRRGFGRRRALAAA